MTKALSTILTVAGPAGTTALVACAALVAALRWLADPYYLQLASTALVTSMFALSLQLLVGGTGLVSLGHAAFFGIGAYTVDAGLLGPSPSVLLTIPLPACWPGSPRWRSALWRSGPAASSS